MTKATEKLREEGLKTEKERMDAKLEPEKAKVQPEPSEAAKHAEATSPQPVKDVFPAGEERIRTAEKEAMAGGEKAPTDAANAAPEPEEPAKPKRSKEPHLPNLAAGDPVSVGKQKAIVISVSGDLVTVRNQEDDLTSVGKPYAVDRGDLKGR